MRSIDSRSEIRRITRQAESGRAKGVPIDHLVLSENPGAMHRRKNRGNPIEKPNGRRKDEVQRKMKTKGPGTRN